MTRTFRRLGARLAAATAVILIAASPGLAAAQQPATNDPGLPLQWNLTAINAPAAWAIATGRGATIAIVDTGIDSQHEDLRGKVVNSVTCMGTDGTPEGCVPGGQDDNGHGTHVAGIAAAFANNGLGIAGVAPDASLLAVKVLGADGSGNASDVSAGIRWAADNGATVINLSLGGALQSVLGSSFSDALEYAWKKGAIPVVAAGNNDLVPGSGFNSTQNVMVVNATDHSGNSAAYSNGVGGAKWGLSAPGGDDAEDDNASCQTAPKGVLSTYWQKGMPNAYACVSGTSMAAPHVSGAAALLRSAGMSPQSAVTRLMTTVTDRGPRGRDAVYGEGTLNLAAATAGLTPVVAVGDGPPVEQPVTTEAPPATATATTRPRTTTTTLPGTPTTTPTSAPSVVTLPDAPPTTADGSAATVSARGVANDDSPPFGLVALAVVLAIGVGASSGGVLMRTADWARRTPG